MASASKTILFIYIRVIVGAMRSRSVSVTLQLKGSHRFAQFNISL